MSSRHQQFISRVLGIFLGISVFAVLFFWGYNSFETLYHVDNVNLARQLIPYARHSPLDFEARRLVGPSYGAILALLAWVLPDPQSAIAAFSFMTAAGVLFMIYFTARRLYSEAAAWFALVCAAATPGFILYVRWGFAYLLFSMAVSLVLMQGAWAWKHQRKFWALWACVATSGIGLVPSLFFWPANNLILLPLALFAALAALRAVGSPKELVRPAMSAVAVSVAGVALLAALGRWYGFESSWSAVVEVAKSLGRRHEAFRGGSSFAVKVGRFWYWAMDFFYRAGAYYQSTSSFDWAECPLLPPAVSILGFVGLALTAARRQDSGKILLVFFLIPLAELCLYFDYSPRYISVFWPVFWIAAGFAASEIWLHFRPPRLRLAARIILAVTLAAALGSGAVRVHLSVEDNRAPANLRWPLASGVLSNKPRLLPALQTAVGELGFLKNFDRNVTYVSPSGDPAHNDVVPARWAAEAVSWISRRHGSLIALGGSSFLPFQLLTQGGYPQAAVPVARLWEDPDIAKEAFVFINFNDPRNDELQRLEYAWPPDPGIFDHLPIPALRLNLAKARRIVVPRRWAANLWPQVVYKPTKAIQSNGLLSSSLSTGQKTEGALWLEIRERSYYRIWCLIKPPDPPGYMSFSLDQGGFVDAYLGSAPEGTSVYWIFMAQRLLAAGAHEIYVECHGPGACLLDRCSAVPY